MNYHQPVTQDGTPSSRSWIIHNKKTGVKYHKEHICRRLLHTSEAFHRRYHKKGLLELHPTGKTKMVLKKGKKSMLTSLKSGWNLLVQDESIFIHIQSQQSKKKEMDYQEKKTKLWQLQVPMRTPSSMEGALSLDGKQFFIQHERFDSLLSFIEHILRRPERSLGDSSWLYR